MPELMNLFLGFDPGGAGRSRGRGNFGWSICYEAGGQLERVETGLARESWDAISQVRIEVERYNRRHGGRVRAVGIDAPLFWTRTARREVDSIIEQQSGMKPLPINSLYGATVVQGPLLVKHINDIWGSLPITESYPKALGYLLAQGGNAAEYQMVQRLVVGLNPDPKESYERDATLCAVSAWAAARQPADWQNLYQQEVDPIMPFGIPVGYWMPMPPPDAAP